VEVRVVGVHSLGVLWAWLNAHASEFFLAGLGVIAAWNWWKWWQDHALALQLRKQKQGPVELKATPKVSVLVAAWNEADIIRAHIESFLRLRYPNKELVLCAGGEDGTHEIARRYAGEQVVLLEQRPMEGKQRALRRCFEKASGEIIFLTDADCLLDDASFYTTLQPILCEGEDIATGTSKPWPWQKQNPFVAYQWAVQVSAQMQLRKYGPGLLGRNCAVRRAALETSGGFNKYVRTGTDYYLARQLLLAGYRIRTVFDSAVATEYPASISRYIHQQSRWLSNLFLHGRATGDSAHVYHALGTGMIGFLGLTLPVAGLLVGPFALAMWLWLVMHSLLARLRYVGISRYIGISMHPTIIVLLPAFLYADWLAWAYALIRVILPTRRWQW